MPSDLYTVLSESRVVPITVLDDIPAALKTAELLISESITILEITLRTRAALEIIKKLRQSFPELTVGAGSISGPESLKMAIDHGAHFAVAPSLDPSTVKYAAENSVPFIPGVATPTELHQALKTSSIIKLFPAAELGGPGYIRAITAPLKMKNFHILPTGGVSVQNFRDYLALDRVVACGMSYIVNPAIIAEGDFNTLRSRIRLIKAGLSEIEKYE